MTGCSAFSVKDVNQGLVDDGLVDTDKIGSGNFYWSKALEEDLTLRRRPRLTCCDCWPGFPGKAVVQLRNQLLTAEKTISRFVSPT
jgi:hypothetical protein